MKYPASLMVESGDLVCKFCLGANSETGTVILLCHLIENHVPNLKRKSETSGRIYHTRLRILSSSVFLPHLMFYAYTSLIQGRIILIFRLKFLFYFRLKVLQIGLFNSL